MKAGKLFFDDHDVYENQGDLIPIPAFSCLIREFYVADKSIPHLLSVEIQPDQLTG